MGSIFASFQYDIRIASIDRFLNGVSVISLHSGGYMPIRDLAFAR